MSRRSVFGIVMGLFLMGGLVWWHGRDLVREAPAVAPPPSAPVVQKSGPPSAPLVAQGEPLPAFGTEAFNKLAKERGAGWMASRNRDASSLLAMWDMTGDEALLREAAEKFPNNPQVCLAMLGVVFAKEGNAGEQKKWTELLIAADPQNPLGYYYQARLAQAAGDRAGVIAALETALEKKDRIDYYQRERMVAAKEGLLASGVPLKDAYYLSLAGPMERASGDMNGLIKLMGFFKTEMAALKTPGRETEFQEMAALGLRVAEQQRFTESPSLMTELIAHSQRMRFLKELDPETEISNTGRSVAEELAVATTERDRLSQLTKEVSSAQEYLLSAPLEVMGQYADRMMMDGEMAAMIYLKEQRAPSLQQQGNATE